MSQAAFASGDPYAAKLAVQQLKNMTYQPEGTASNIIVLVAHSTDMKAIFSEADKQSMLEWPYVWIVSDGASTAVANTLPVELAAKLAGILQIQISPVALPGFARYQAAWQRLTPAECARLVPGQLQLDQSAFEGTADTSGAYAYDAAAAAALAMRAVAADNSTAPSNSNTASYGARLNAAIRALNFSGATGHVSFQDGSGDRAPGDQELVLSNWLWHDGALSSEMTVSVKLSSLLAAANARIGLVDYIAEHVAEHGGASIFNVSEANNRSITWLGSERKAWWIRGGNGTLDGEWPQDAIKEARENRTRSFAEREARDKADRKQRRVERRRLAIGLGLAFFCTLLLALFLFVRVRFPNLFRKTIKLVSEGDGTIAPNVTFITDIEGNWEVLT